MSGVIDDWAREIIRAIGSYTEVSPSGTGIRIFCLGKLPRGRRKNGNVEMYDESSPKYLTITGNHVPGTTRTLERRQTEVERAHAEYLGGETEPKTPEKRQPLTPIEHPVTRPMSGTITVDDIVEKASHAANGEKFMRLYFSQPGDQVVDPLGGAFTTAVACKRHDRKCISCDNNEAAVIRGQDRLRGTSWSTASNPIA